MLSIYELTNRLFVFPILQALLACGLDARRFFEHQPLNIGSFPRNSKLHARELAQARNKPRSQNAELIEVLDDLPLRCEPFSPRLPLRNDLALPVVVVLPSYSTSFVALLKLPAVALLPEYI